MSNAMPPPQRAPGDNQLKAYPSTQLQQPSIAHNQNPHQVINVPPFPDTRSRIVSILAQTANGCLAELNFHSLQKRLQDLERNKMVVFQDNQKLVQMLNEEKRKVELLPKENSELFNMVITLQNQLKTVQDQIEPLRAEKDRWVSDYKALVQEKGTPPSSSLQQLTISYNELARVHQMTVERLRQTELQLGALSAHCRRCPTYAQQVQSFHNSPNGAQQHPLNASHHKRGHPGQRRASAPNATAGSSQPPTPIIPGQTPQMNSTALVGLPHQQVMSGGHPTVAVSPKTQFQQVGMQRPPSWSLTPPNSSVYGPMYSYLQSNPSNRLHASQIQPNGSPKTNSPLPSGSSPSPVPQSLRQQPQSRPTSSSGYFTNVNVNDHPSFLGGGIIGAPSVIPTASVPQQLVEHPLENSGLTNQPQPRPGIQRAQSIISVSSGSRPNSAASATFHSVPLNQYHANSNSNQQQQLDPGAATTLGSQPPVPSPATSQKAGPSLSKSSFTNTFSGQYPTTSPRLFHTAEKLNEVATPPPPSASSTVDGCQFDTRPPSTHANIDTPRAGTSSKRNSTVLESSPHATSEDSRKKMRMSSDVEQTDATGVVQDVPLTEAASQTHSERAGETDEDGDDEEDIAVGPDGLRLVPDCLSELFETRGEGRMCRLCRSRFERGLVGEPASFINTSDDALVDHCIAEHDQVWNELRHDV